MALPGYLQLVLAELASLQLANDAIRVRNTIVVLLRQAAL